MYVLVQMVLWKILREQGMLGSCTRNESFLLVLQIGYELTFYRRIIGIGDRVLT